MGAAISPDTLRLNGAIADGAWHLKLGHVQTATNAFREALRVLKLQASRAAPFPTGEWPIQHIPRMVLPLLEAVEASEAVDGCLPCLAELLSAMERMFVPFDARAEDRTIQGITLQTIDALMQQGRMASLRMFGDALVQFGAAGGATSDAVVLGRLVQAELAARVDNPAAECLWLDILAAKRGASHGDSILARTLSSLGRYYLETSQLGAARALLLPFYDPQADLLGPYNDVDRIVVMHLSAVYRESGDLHAALPLLRKAIGAAAVLEGGDAPGLVPMYLDLAVCLIAQPLGRPDEIEAVFERACVIAEAASHPDLEMVRDLYADWLSGQGRFAEAHRVRWRA